MKPATSARRRIAFLVFNRDGADGVSRSVVTLANELARQHDVEVISLYRRNRGPAYALVPEVRVRYLLHRSPPRRGTRPASPWPPRRGSVAELLARGRSLATRGRAHPDMSLLTDVAMARALRRLDADVLVSTRPSLHAAAARLAPSQVVTVGQDHLNYVSRLQEAGSIPLIELAASRGLDAFVTLTAEDEADYRRHLAAHRTHVRRIPNALSWPVSAPVDRRESRTVVSVGRLVRRKGMGRLVHAFAPVAEKHPDWSLEIYGPGKLEDKIRGIIARRGLEGRVHLRGHTDDLPRVLDGAALLASASRAEGFPMVMLEAMSTGLPLVAFDCPRGPAELVDESNGVLVPNGDVPGLTAALESLVSDADLRARLGEGSRRRAEEYAVDKVAARWSQLFEDLLADRKG